MLKPVTGTAPSHWASYLINGDASGIDDSDVMQADKFAAWLGGGGPVSCSEESFFAWTHDAMRVCGTLAADCLEYTALVEVSDDMAQIVQDNDDWEKHHGIA